MLAGIFPKILASSLLVGSFVGGGYGISQAFNKSSVASSKERKEEIAVEKEKYNTPKNKEKQLEQVLEKEEKKLDVKLNKPKLTERNKEVSSREIKLEEKVVQISERLKEPTEDRHNENPVTYENQEESEKLKEFDEYQKQDKEEKIRLSKEEEKDISLEANWMFTVGSEISKNSICFLLKNDQEKINIPDLHDDFEDSCNDTNWYKWMEYEYKKENLWIRGKKSLVKELVKVNEDNWSSNGSKFLNKNNSQENYLEFDKELCLVQDSKDKDWIEIKCSSLGKSNHLSS